MFVDLLCIIVIGNQEKFKYFWKRRKKEKKKRKREERRRGLLSFCYSYPPHIQTRTYTQTFVF
jgi:hypothetical protein